MTIDLHSLAGSLTGDWRTYLRPNELYDEAGLTAELGTTDDGWILTYNGAIKEDDVEGRMHISADGSTITWNDTWHTEAKDAVLTADDGLPSYTYGPDDEPWTWSIEVRPGRRSSTTTHRPAWTPRWPSSWISHSTAEDRVARIDGLAKTTRLRENPAAHGLPVCHTHAVLLPDFPRFGAVSACQTE